MGCKLTALKKLREERGITQKEIAEACNVTPQYISTLERGINELDYSLALEIAQFLNATPDALFLEDFKNNRKIKREEDEKNFQIKSLEAAKKNMEQHFIKPQI